MNTHREWMMAVGAAVMLSAGAVLAGTATSTTTTTTTSTTTTTLLGGCDVAATFASVLCRIDALIAETQAATDLGRLQGGIVGSAQKAKKQCTAASQKTGKSASNQLKKCAKSLDTYRHKLDSNNAHKIIPPATRTLYRDQASQIRSDVNSMR